MSETPQYYDWEKTLAYDADVTMVVGARGLGKTFGLRLQCVRDYIKKGLRFVEVCRFKNEVSGIAHGYYDKIGIMDEFKDYQFRTDGRFAYIAKFDKNNPDKKVKWDIIGYFVSLTEAQKMKRHTFIKVRRIIFDEFILEKTDRFHNYLLNEYATLAKLVDTVSRERPDVDGIKPRLYLLGNALDLANPYFTVYKVHTDIKFGYRWYKNKTVLLHYVDSAEYSAKKQAKTVAGRMLENTIDGKMGTGNIFIVGNNEFVKRKPSRAKFNFGIILNGNSYGIWLDASEGLYHVTNIIPKGTEQPIYSLTASDNTINYIAANRATKTLRVFSEAYYLGIIRYENVSVKSGFMEVLSCFGIK